VRVEELSAGRPAPELVADLSGGFYLHSYFYYLHRAGWDSRDRLSKDELVSLIDGPATARPVLLPAERYRTMGIAGGGGEGRPPATLALGDVVLLLPGPYGKCGAR
jgi:hypothetical protein